MVVLKLSLVGWEVIYARVTTTVAYTKVIIIKIRSSMKLNCSISYIHRIEETLR